jgi:anthranilate phosphoribosyltransferase
MTWVESLIGRVSAGQDLSLAEMAEAMDAIMRGECSASQIGRLLMALRAKGECVSEVAGAAQAMRKHMTRIRTKRTGAIDTCGTGGDGSAMFNISTAAAIVAAAAGATVAKHGNRRVSSTSGSADVLAALGVNVEANVAQVEACLDELGICFCFAPLMHPSMRHVAEVRRQLGVPTIFNLLGPLCNPADARVQLLGVGKPHLRPLLAEALVLLGTDRAVVVCGEDGLDEVTLAGRTLATEARGTGQREFCWAPEDFGLRRSPLTSMRVKGPQESAAVIRQVLDGQRGLPRDIVVLNAAAALWTAAMESSPSLAARRAEEAIDTGRASSLLARLAELSAA